MNKEEDILLAQCFQFLWNTRPELRHTFWHVANERKTSPISGAILKAKGVLSGVPDFVINYAGKTHYIEFKSKTGTLSTSQKEVHAALEKQGFKVYICKDFESFKDIISKIVVCNT